jgi:lysozyme family protein
MVNFSMALDRTLKFEGGYSNHPDDRGGETYCGISRVHNPDWHGWSYIDGYKEVKPMPNNGPKFQEEDIVIRLRFLVAAFYKKLWDSLDLDSIDHQALTSEIFEVMVNMGTPRAVKFLQEALNVLNRNAALYPDLVVDGVFGPVTRKLLHEQKADYGLIEKIVIVLRGSFYLDIVRRDPTQEAFIKGWLNRVRVG